MIARPPPTSQLRRLCVSPKRGVFGVFSIRGVLIACFFETLRTSRSASYVQNVQSVHAVIMPLHASAESVSVSPCLCLPSLRLSRRQSGSPRVRLSQTVRRVSPSDVRRRIRRRLRRHGVTPSASCARRRRRRGSRRRARTVGRRRRHRRHGVTASAAVGRGRGPPRLSHGSVTVPVGAQSVSRPRPRPAPRRARAGTAGGTAGSLPRGPGPRGPGPPRRAQLESRVTVTELETRTQTLAQTLALSL